MSSVTGYLYVKEDYVMTRAQKLRKRKIMENRRAKQNSITSCSDSVKIRTVHMESSLRKRAKTIREKPDMVDYVYKQPKQELMTIKEDGTKVMKTLTREPVLHKGVQDYRKSRSVKKKSYAKDDRIMSNGVGNGIMPNFKT